MAVVYKHYKKDTKELFYIGIGLTKSRAFSKKSRNILWHNIVKKHDYFVEIYKENLSILEAKEEEKRLISFYGRLDLKNGVLCNMTDGGDGNNNLSIESKNKISEKLKGKKLSQETIIKRKNTQKELWNSDAYFEKREKARIRAIFNHKNGVISRTGKTSTKKGKPFVGDKEKISRSLKEYYLKNDVYNKKHYKVNQYDLSGYFIKTYESHHDVKGVLPKRILEVCKGKRKSTKKFKFTFYENNTDWD